MYRDVPKIFSILDRSILLSSKSQYDEITQRGIFIYPNSTSTGHAQVWKFILPVKSAKQMFESVVF